MANDRDEKGRWNRNYKPPKSTGRPKGSKNKPKPPQIEMMAQVKAAEMITSMIGKAADVIDSAVSMSTEVIVMGSDGEPKMDAETGQLETMIVGGDAQIAKWLLDRTLPRDFSMLAATVDADISTIDGVIQASQEVMEHMLNRTLPLEQCERVMRVLGGYAHMRAFEGIEELKLIIEKHEDLTSKVAGGSSMPDGLTPMWGRLMETLDKDNPINGKPANTQPAE